MKNTPVISIGDPKYETFVFPIYERRMSFPGCKIWNIRIFGKRKSPRLLWLLQTCHLGSCICRFQWFVFCVPCAIDGRKYECFVFSSWFFYQQLKIRKFRIVSWIQEWLNIRNIRILVSTARSAIHVSVINRFTCLTWRTRWGCLLPCRNLLVEGCFPDRRDRGLYASEILLDSAVRGVAIIAQRRSRSIPDPKNERFVFSKFDPLVSSPGCKTWNIRIFGNMQIT